MNSLEKKNSPKIEEVMNYDEDVAYESFAEDMNEEETFNAKLIEHIVTSSCGKDASGHPKAAITLGIEMWTLKNNTSRNVATYSSNKPVIDIQKHYDFIQIDMQFASKIDNDLKVLWSHIERFGKTLDGINEGSREVPFFTLTIVPVEEQGGYYIVCTNPIFWCLQPAKPGMDANVLRMQFRSEDVGFFESDDIDMYEIEANVQRSLLERERVAEMYEQNEDEKAKFTEERNRKMEELRKNGEFTD